MRRLIHWRSLQARLLLGALAWISAGTILSGLAISGLFREHVTNQFTHELNDHLTELQNLYLPGAPGRVLRPVSDPRFALPESGYYWEVTPQGAEPLRSPSLAGRDLRYLPTSQDPMRGVVPGSTERLVTIERWSQARGGAGPVQMLVAGDAAELQATIADFDRQLTVSLATVGGGLGLAAILQVTIGLRPLRRLQRALASVRSGEAQDLPADFPTEVQPLVSELNDVVRHNREVIQRARAQAGNLGHALRTHLAILTSHAEQMAADGRKDEAAAVLAECQSMSRQVDYHVARARAAASRGVIGAIARPAGMAGEILSALGRLHGGRGLTLTNDLPSELAVACDPDDLYEMVANLLDNAAKWARAAVRISGEAADGEVRLRIDDDGPGLPPDRLEAALGRGVRLDERVDGSGLGLAIVRDLADLYGGSIELGRGDLGGARATLRLPAVPTR